METLRIEWETGYMELNVKAFFPCNLQKARKIAPLINRYCTEEDRAALLSELRGMAEFYQKEIEELKAMKCCKTRIRENEVLKKRVERNIGLIEGGKKNGKIQP